MEVQTCPKCGKQFYGVGCPDCDFPASPPDMGKIRRQQFIAFVLLAALLIILVRLFIEKPPFRLPVLAGILGLVLLGRMLASDVRGRAYALAVGLLLAVLSPGFFYCTFSERAHWSAGLLAPFLPWWWNDTTTRWLTGFFGCLCAALSLWCFYQVASPRKRK